MNLIEEYQDLKNKAGEILKVLAKKPNQLVTYEEIIKKVYGKSYPVDETSYNLLRIYVMQIRDYIEVCELGHELLTVSGQRRNVKGLYFKTK